MTKMLLQTLVVAIFIFGRDSEGFKTTEGISTILPRLRAQHDSQSIHARSEPLLNVPVDANDNPNFDTNIDYVKLLPSLYEQISKEIQVIRNTIKGGHSNSPVFQQRDKIINEIDNLQFEYDMVLKNHLRSINKEIDILRGDFTKLKTENESLMKLAKEITEKNRQMVQVTKNAPDLFNKLRVINGMVKALKRI